MSRPFPIPSVVASLPFSRLRPFATLLALGMVLMPMLSGAVAASQSGASQVAAWLTTQPHLALPARSGEDAPASPQQLPADLAVVKSCRSTTLPLGIAIAGREVLCTITVTNESVLIPAQQVSVVDDFPAEFVYVADNSGCEMDGEDLVCGLGNLTPGASRTIEVKFRVDPAAVVDEPDGAISVENVASVSALNPDPAPANNVARASIFIQDEADLRLTKMSKPHDVVRAGEAFSYTIFVDNLGPSAARNVVITDTLITQGTVDPFACSMSILGEGGISVFDCLLGADSGVWTVATFGATGLWPMSPQDPGRIVIRLHATASATFDYQSINNEARVTADTPDPNKENNFAVVPLSVQAVADLAVTKRADMESADAGGFACWTMTVTNDGPSPAENVKLIDVTPRGLVDGSITAGPGCTLGTPGDPLDPLVCDLGRLEVGATVETYVCGDVDPAFVARQPRSPAADYLDNDVWVTSDTFDADNSDNRATDFIYVTESADLSLRKFLIGTPTAGAEVHYEYQITNAGPSVSRDVTFRDFLPRDVEFLSASVDYENGLGLVPLSCTVTVGSNALFCPLGDVPLTGDNPILVFVNVRIKPTATGSITNSADVNLSDTPDPVMEGNSASVETDLRYAADVDIAKTAVSSSVTLPGDNRAGTIVGVGGGTITYRIRVVNNGPSTIYNAVVTDPLNQDLEYRYSTSALCSLVAGTVTCDLGDIQPGEVKEFDVIAAVHEGTTTGGVPTLDNEACVDWMLGDETEGRACDEESVPADPVSDLRIRKFGKPDGEVRAGKLLTYTIIVDNLGPSFAPTVTVTDELRASGVFDIMGLLPDATGQYDLNANCVIDAPASNAPINPIYTNLPVGVPYVPGADPIVPGVNQRATITCELNNQGTGELPVFGPPYTGTNTGSGEGRWIIEVAVMAREGVSINNCADVSSDALDPDFANNSTCTAHEITEVADLSVTKTASGEVGGCGQLLQQEDGVTPGNKITYRVTVANNGPSRAENVVIQDRLPPGITVTNYSVTDGAGNVRGSCTTGTPGSWLDQLVCGIDTLATGTGAPPAGPVVLQFTATVDPAVPAGAILENDVVVMSDQFDDDNSDNFASSLVAAYPVADLRIDKRGPESHAAGTTETYHLHVGNNGPSVAQNVMVADIVPPGMRILRATVMGGQNPNGVLGNACVIHNLFSFDPLGLQYNPSNAVTCDLGNLPPGLEGERDIAVDVYVMPDVVDSTRLRNEAYVFSGTLLGQEYTPDCDYDNNAAEWTTTALTMADLWLTKDSEPQKVYAGEQKKYIIRVGNDGPADAQNVVVRDVLPPEVTYETDTDHCVLVDDPQTPGQDLDCSLGTIKVGQVVEFWIWVRVGACVPAGTTIVNRACVPWEEGVNTTLGDPDPSDNCDDAKNLVLQKADLKIVKFGKMDGQVRAGDVLTYTIMVDNLGPSCATDVAVKDLLQSSERFDVLDVFSDRSAVSVAVPPHSGGNPQTLAATQWPQVWPPLPPLAQVNPPTGIGGVNQRLQWDVRLTEGDDPETPANEGTLGVLAADGPPNTGRWILTMRVRAAETQDINNIADVVSHVAWDPDRTNNHAEVMHEITDVADLQVTKSATGEEQQVGQRGLIFNNANPDQQFPTSPNYFGSIRVTAGRRVLYTLTVRNNGPSTAENVVLSDRLPAGVQIYQGSLVAPAGVNCETGTPGQPLDRLTCGLGTIGPGGSKTISFQVVTDSGLKAGTVLENDAHVSSDIFDPVNGNNYANTQNTVLAAADMAVVKSAMGEVVSYDATLRREVVTDTPNQVTPGRVLRYEATVQNNGPSDARNVTVKDTLPPTTQVTYWYADGADCRPDDVQNNVLYCSLGDMAAGERKTFDIYVVVDPAVPSGTALTNCVDVLYSPSNTSPPGPPDPIAGVPPTLVLIWDPYPGDNRVCTSPTAVPRVDVYIEKSDVPAEARLDTPFEPDQAIAGTEHRYLITFGNYGPSRAENVTVQDQLDFKQAGILGETFVRCEPMNPGEQVSCAFAAPNLVNVTGYKSGNETILPGGLNPGERFSFWLITKVDSGYVLDADDFLAQNCASISTTSADVRTANNADCEQTLIVAEADLEITKTDVYGTDPTNGFLQCDPVGRGGTIRYRVTVTNKGPSDAAQVYVVDTLPVNGVVLDPAKVKVTPSAGQIVEIRDDGRITVVLGNDANNAKAPQLGRLNVGSSETIDIEVMVTLTAPCGGVLVNTATVETRRNDSLWPPVTNVPFPGIGAGPRTPTYDPVTENNKATQGTTVECPAIEIDKTISFDGTCPGGKYAIFDRPGQPVTFCFEIKNTGTTYLDYVYIEDVFQTRTGRGVVFTDTIRFGVDPNLPVAPGEVIKRQVTLPHLCHGEDCECGIAIDTVTVTAVPVNSGRTIYPCLPQVTDSDSQRVNVPCAGVDMRLALPALATLGLPKAPTPLSAGTLQQVTPATACESWVQVQNVGKQPTKAMIVVWGPAGACPPQAAGPLKVECSGLLRPGSSWSFAPGMLPQGARSGIVYSLNAVDKVPSQYGQPLPFADVVCREAFYTLVGDYFAWMAFDEAYRLTGVFKTLDFGAHQGEPLAVMVNRTCPDPMNPNTTGSAAYKGISTDLQGAPDPYMGGWMYYAPMVFANKAGLTSFLYIQNVGIECSSLELWFKDQENCLRPVLGDVLSLAPGESVIFDPSTVVGPDWLGSGWIRASQPMAMVVDTVGANHFTSYNGVPGDVWSANPEDVFSLGTQVNYAPLIYNQHQGWDTALLVQNLSSTVASKVKVYFLDQSGGVVHTMVDWICPRGSQTFYLPVIDAIPGNWVGSARVESQEWWTPGDPQIDPPRLQTVVLLEKWADPARTDRREAVAYNAATECDVFNWQIGAYRGGIQSGSAVIAVPLLAKQNRGITSELAITNLVPKPGFTDFAIYVYDQNGLLDVACEKLNEKQVEYIDLNTWGWISRNFLGSAVISAIYWEHDVLSGDGQFERNVVGLGAVIVERIGGTMGAPDVPGDESKAVEAMPVFNFFLTEHRPNCPGIPGVMKP